MEVPETNNHPPQLYIIILKFLAYFIFYIIIPICIFWWGNPVLADIIRPIISVVEIRLLVCVLANYIAYKLYKLAVSIGFGILQFNLRNEWINYLTLKGKKISYYKRITPFVEALRNG